jgi:hypothetical protein
MVVYGGGPGGFLWRNVLPSSLDADTSPAERKTMRGVKGKGETREQLSFPFSFFNETIRRRKRNTRQEVWGRQGEKEK